MMSRRKQADGRQRLRARRRQALNPHVLGITQKTYRRFSPKKTQRDAAARIYWEILPLGHQTAL